MLVIVSVLSENDKWWGRLQLKEYMDSDGIIYRNWVWWHGPDGFKAGDWDWVWLETREIPGMYTPQAHWSLRLHPDTVVRDDGKKYLPSEDDWYAYLTSNWTYPVPDENNPTAGPPTPFSSLGTKGNGVKFDRVSDGKLFRWYDKDGPAPDW